MAEPRELDRCVEGAARAHQRLLGHLDEVVERHPDAARTPSLLPGWTVGHVLTHLARNAESHVGLFEAAMRGEIADQYPGGAEQRAADIERGASRDLDVQVADVRRTIWELEAVWARCTELGWSGSGRTRSGQVAVSDLPFQRWREVEVHHADLRLGVGFDDWSPEYVRRELVRQQMVWRSRRPVGLGELPPQALSLRPELRLAWLLGRHRVEGLPDVGEL